MLQWQGRVHAGEPLTLQYRLGVEGVSHRHSADNLAQLHWMEWDEQLGPVTTVVTLPHGAMRAGHIKAANYDTSTASR